MLLRMKTTELVFGKCLKLMNRIELRRIDQQLFRQMPIDNCCALSFGYIGHRVVSIDRVSILMSHFSRKTILTVPATILADQMQARAKPNLLGLNQFPIFEKLLESDHQKTPPARLFERYF